jgi:AraC-like DNA-binding protein
MAQEAGYREWRPAEALSRHLACTWAGRLGSDGTPFTDRVLPDGCIDIIWDGARLFVAGPDTGPVALARQPGAYYVGVRFRPGLAPTFLGVPASELLDQRVDAGDLLGHPTAALLERLQGDAAAYLRPALPRGEPEEGTSGGSLRGMARVLESAMVRWLPGAKAPDPLVEAAVAALGGDAFRPRPPVGALAALGGDAFRPRPPVGALAADLGMSERQLHRRCTAAVGYGPKTLDRVLRFRRFLALAAGDPGAGLAGLAVAAGYADQAHLTRECGRLGGAPPGRLVPRLAPAA